MKNSKTARNRDFTKVTAELYMAIDLGSTKWTLHFSDGERDRKRSIAAGDIAALQKEIEKTKIKFRFPLDVPVKSCYEAGRDGFWIHRYLLENGIENLVVDSSSIEVNRRKRQVKTDPIDALKLVHVLIRYHRPVHRRDKKILSVVRVPGRREEDDRRLDRELERLKQDRGRLRNRIRSILATQGLQVVRWNGFLNFLETARLWDGSKIPDQMKSELCRAYARQEQVHHQILQVERDRVRRIHEGKTPSARCAAQLQMLKGIGPGGASLLAYEFFGWRDFQNRRQVGSAAGLTPTPHHSDQTKREQGISKCGNRRVRWMTVELSWRWLQYQPKSQLSRWFRERFEVNKRSRRVGIVALARKLLIAWWRYVKYGEVPEGALLKTR
jgi:transposase